MSFTQTAITSVKLTVAAYMVLDQHVLPTHCSLTGNLWRAAPGGDSFIILFACNWVFYWCIWDIICSVWFYCTKATVNKPVSVVAEAPPTDSIGPLGIVPGPIAAGNAVAPPVLDNNPGIPDHAGDPPPIDEEDPHNPAHEEAAPANAAPGPVAVVNPPAAQIANAIGVAPAVDNDQAAEDQVVENLGPRHSSRVRQIHKPFSSDTFKAPSASKPKTTSKRKTTPKPKTAPKPKAAPKPKTAPKRKATPKESQS